MVRAGRALFLWSACCFAAANVHTYIGQLGPRSVLIAWGTTSGSGNTIGRDSTPLGRAAVTVGGRTVEASHNWAVVDGLEPDTAYDYHVEVNGKRIGAGKVRTWAEKADRLAFFVIGDYGTGSSKQRAVAQAMAAEFERRRAGGNPVRFVLTVGDNIYADVNLGYTALRSGDQDRHWESKFFAPYREILGQVPFLPTLGNHDGNATESRGDLAVYLDNFFFPGSKPARWYEFSYGGLADFFALDSTDNTTEGRPAPAYSAGGQQFQWLGKALPAARAPWKIAYFHHPPFNAGPRHGASLAALAHFLEVFQNNGVRVVFSGHEHNFQFSEDSAATGHIRYVISGAGGELRRGNVTGAMAQAHIEGWAAARHFLLVEIEGRVMSVTPLSNEAIRVQDRNGKPVRLPLRIALPE
jgi:hypothetical protein